MKIYTKTGDDGTTGLLGGTRVAKDSARIEAYGTLDELNALLGAARSELGGDELDEVVARIQSELFALGAELADPSGRRGGQVGIGPREVEALEAEIDRWDSRLSPLRAFVLPGGSRAAAQLHLARTVCRRAERRVLALAAVEDLGTSSAVVYLNRLSDHLFVAARYANRLRDVGDVPWRPIRN